MNELTLSNDLQIITAEINSYKQIAGQSVFEIGKRLKHVKENDLAHGLWESWCTKELNISPRQARKYIRVADRFSNRKLPSEMGLEKMDALAVFDDEELEEPVKLQTGEEKKLIDMSSYEIDKYKKSLKAAEKTAAEAEQAREEAEQRAAQLESDKQSAIEQQRKLMERIRELKNTPQRSPEDEKKLRELNEENLRLMQANRRMEDEMIERNAAMEKRSYDLRKMKESLNKTRAYVDVDLSSALMYFMSIRDQREAQEVAERFWKSLDDTIAKNRREWNALLQNPIIEEVGKDARKIIDIGGD